jgi:hypothetical protein
LASVGGGAAAVAKQRTARAATSACVRSASIGRERSEVKKGNDHDQKKFAPA